ncbi:MAG: DUF2470 domain-containing protein [Pseudomonadota bacterium]
MSEKSSLLQPVDEAVRQQAKTLVRAARFGALAVLSPSSNTPQISRVGVATNQVGAPVILISQLSPHFAALENNPKAAVLLGEPGRGDPLAHPRISVSVSARKVTDAEERANLRGRYLARHPKSALYIDFADFAFWVLGPQSASLNGGYGKAYELDRDDVMSVHVSELVSSERDAVDHMNADHLDAIDIYAGQALADPGQGWMMASLDAEGMDLIRKEELIRVWYPNALTSAQALRPTLVAMVKKMRRAAGYATDRTTETNP